MKKLILMAMAAMLALPAMAQFGPEWGETDEQKEANTVAYTIFSSAVKRGDWPLAVENLHALLNNAPKAHTAIYTLAMDMYKKRADDATDAAEKTMMADSLILMHDRYAEMFPDVPQVPQVLMNKGIHTRTYFGEDRARVMEVFRKGAEAAGTKMPALYVQYFNELTVAYKSNEMTVEEYLAEFDKISSEIATANAPEQQAQLEQIFVSSGAADCNTIESVYGPKIEADPTNAKQLDRVIALMNRGNCKGEFYMSVAEKLYKVAPTAMVARIIAASYKAKGDNATATKFLDEAIALATTPQEKSDVLLGVASDELFAQNYRNAYNRAHDVVAIYPQNATAHYLMALATSGGASGCNDAMSQRSVYWLAYDRMQQARQLATADPATKPELLQEMEKNLARFAAAFPEAQEIFMQGLTEGAAYNVNCGWVSGRTTVRRRP